MVPPTSEPKGMGHNQDPGPSQTAQGLHLLSEAAMGNNQQHPQQQPTDPAYAQWYAQPQMNMNAMIDPNPFHFDGGGFYGIEFDYGMGMFGAGDGSMNGMFIQDPMPGFGQPPQDPNNPQGYGGMWP